MWKIGFIGIVSALLGLILKKDKPEFAMVTALAAGILIMGLAMDRILFVIGFIQETLGKTGLQESYLVIILKMLGISYCADFSANICKDAGHSAIAGQIEVFAKLSIIVLSIPGLKYFVEVLERVI